MILTSAALHISSEFNVTYRMVCEECRNTGENHKHIYLGCTGKSTHSRMMEHIRDVNSKDLSNSMAKHMEIKHREEQTDTKFSAEIITTHRSCLIRFVDESLRIDKEREYICNSKSEWGGRPLKRPTVGGQTLDHVDGVT